MGPGDHKCSDGQLRIATKKARDKHDIIIVQEKLDGSNVGVAKIKGEIVPLTRAGYRAETSPFDQHHAFADWVLHPKQKVRFDRLLIEGERVCGEWLMQAHGTRYDLKHEPFVAFDLMDKTERVPYDVFYIRVVTWGFVVPNMIHIGGPLSIEKAMEILGKGKHGAIDPIEGAIWRVEQYKQVKKGYGSERKRIVDYLAKYVRPDKKDGIYLPEVSGKPAVYNWKPC